ncbi:MAG TPA: aminotransferase class V-fold PLP-dependent enzyme [Caulobacteraceae bacterium]|jgi:selenocysteine lyase/cysteine desulfurase|nr:aminotransferase class V-fold PLP-dependent enzyme [Caulobacteraceae bacterium]
MKFKHLFTHALSAAPGRLHMAAHSHHLWPDASREAQIQCWDDAATFADRKWDKVMGEVWTKARSNVATELKLPSPDSVVFAPNTHELIVRLVSAFPKRPLRVLSTDGEFHSFRRQGARWAESGTFELELVPSEPFGDFAERFLAKAKSGNYDLIFVSQVFFKSGRVFEKINELARVSKPEGPWVVLDGYHGFLAIPTDFKRASDRVFYLAGGYKYAMAGEGAAFMHAPAGYGPRPEVSGWYAEFADLEGSPGAVGFARDATRFMGATFDPSGLYRFNAAFQMLADQGLSTTAVSAHVAGLQAQFLDLVEQGEAGPFKDAELLNPLGAGPHARFLAFRHPEAQAWKAKLLEADAVTDVRDDVLRVGLGLYHDPEDIDRFASVCKQVLKPRN